MDDAAIHRVLEDADGVVCSGSQGQWIATGLRPRDDKVGLVCDDRGNSQSLLFTLHPSNFTLPSLAFLEGEAKAYIGATTI